MSNTTFRLLRNVKYANPTLYCAVRYYRSNLLPPHTKIKMPSVGDGNQSGEITKWYKQIGDAIKLDDALCEIEMDDLTLDLEADCDGYLAEISVPEGIIVKSGTTIARQVETEQHLETFLDSLKSSRDTAERDLVFAYRILSELGFEDYININHLSVSIPSLTIPWNKTMLTGKDGFCWHQITRKDLIEIDIEQRLKQTKTLDDLEAMDVYCTLIQKTPTINTVFHINTPSLLTFSSISPNQLLMLNPICARFLNRVMYVDSLDEMYAGSFITVANVIVIRNHGVVVTGSSIEQAFDTFFYFEQMVQLQLKILELQGKNIEILEMDEEQAQTLQRKYLANQYPLAKQHFDARKRSIIEKEEELLEESED
eukprot:163431_1